MRVQTSDPVLILAYGQYVKDGKPMVYEQGPHVGQVIENVTFLDPADPENPIQASLAPTINGDRVPPGHQANLLANVTMITESFPLATGRSRTVKRAKWRVAEMAAVTPSATTKS
jgi:hypothetical protein